METRVQVLEWDLEAATGDAAGLRRDLGELWDEVEEAVAKAVKSLPRGANGARGMRRADALAALVLLSNRRRSIGLQDALLLLREIGDEDWPTTQRPHLAPSDAKVFVLGLTCPKHNREAPCLSVKSREYPSLCKAIARYCAVTLPDFAFTSIQLSRNIVAKAHKDSNNDGLSAIITMGDHRDGGLQLNGTTLRCHNKWHIFDGNNEHETEGWTGDERFAVICYAHRSHIFMDMELANKMTSELYFPRRRSTSLVFKNGSGVLAPLRVVWGGTEA